VLSGAGPFEPRTAGGPWVDGSKGLSIPLPDTRMRVRVGRTKGRYVRAPEEPTVIDRGTATITDRRAIFGGARQVREWQWAKLVGVIHDPARCATAIQVSNRQNVSGITYKGGDPEQVHLAFDVATALAEGRDEKVLAELRAMLPALAEVGTGDDAEAEIAPRTRTCARRPGAARGAQTPRRGPAPIVATTPAGVGTRSRRAP